jgi:DUF218 domain
MSAYSGTIRPEESFRQQLHLALRRRACQEPVNHRAICICGTSFDPETGPSPRLISRMRHARKLIKTVDGNIIVVASGGLNGTAGSLWSEAQLIDLVFQRWGFVRLYHEDFSAESVGNIVFAFLGFLLPLGATEVTFVTDDCHAPRVNRLAQHILKGLMKVSVTAAPWPLSHAEFEEEFKRELAGYAFVDELLSDVPPGMPEYAFDWISDNHKSHPYLGWDIEEVVTVMRGQVLDFNPEVFDLEGIMLGEVEVSQPLSRQWAAPNGETGAADSVATCFVPREGLDVQRMA